MGTKQLATRVDEDQAREFRENTRRLGTTPSDAMRMFIVAFNECRGFPYDLRVGALGEITPFDTEAEATDFATRISRKTLDATR